MDYLKYAEAFEAKGLMINKPDEIASVMTKAFDTAGPVIVGVHVDYRDNHQLFEMLHEDSINERSLRRCNSRQPIQQLVLVAQTNLCR